MHHAILMERHNAIENTSSIGFVLLVFLCAFIIFQGFPVSVSGMHRYNMETSELPADHIHRTDGLWPEEEGPGCV